MKHFKKRAGGLCGKIGKKRIKAAQVYFVQIKFSVKLLGAAVVN